MSKLTRRVATVELADGRILETRITNPDTMRYEHTAQTHGWPGMTVKDGITTVADATRRATFEVWASLKRTKQYDGTWETFEQTDCLDFNVEEEEVDPTRPDPGTGSSPISPGLDGVPSPNSLEPTTS